MDPRVAALVAGLPSTQHGLTSARSGDWLVGRMRTSRIPVVGSLISRDGRFTDRARVGTNSGPASGPGVAVWWGLGEVLRDNVVVSRGSELETAKGVAVTTFLVLSGWLHEQDMFVSSWEGKGRTPAGCTEPLRWRPLLGTKEVCASWWAGGTTADHALLQLPVYCGGA